MNGTDVWVIPVPQVSLTELLSHSHRYLSEDERHRLHGRRLSKGQFTFLLTRYALRDLLSFYAPDIAPADWEFSRTESGKPVVSGPVSQLSFNLSHADGMMVMAFASDGEVGIDLEHGDRAVNAEALSARYFTDAEHQQLMSLSAADRVSRFLEIWTLKEACVKASGLGLSRALRQYEFILQDDTGLSMMEHAQPCTTGDLSVRWQLWSCAYAGYRIALAKSALMANRESPADPDLTVREFLWPQQIRPVQLRVERYFSG
tara:strand:- start:19558 stop:20337 length:780 start_codon:yes stop_codon:yes gene_type:complete